MTRIEFAPQVFDDFDLFLDHMAKFEIEGAATRMDEIVRVIDILGYSPLIGRPLKGGKRELIIGRRARLWCALPVCSQYRYGFRSRYSGPTGGRISRRSVNKSFCVFGG